MAKSPLLSVRIDAALLAQLEKAAEKDGRTLSNLVQKILADWAAAQKKR